jgi:glucose-6-phosphate dehydrogenase assembly protein OpcA
MEAPVNYPKSSELERDLVSRLRESASGNARAMAATVVVAGASAEADSGDSLVDRLMGLRPARIVHLRTQAPEAEGFRAWSSARCSLDRQNRGVCFEDIYIESSTDAALDPRAWGPFVMRELPALLVWRFPVEALSDADGDQAERADLVVIDGSRDASSAGCGPAAYAERVLGAKKAVPALTDLAWERGERARTATARLFDPPGAPADLDSAVSIAAAGPDPWGTALNAAWIASALGWKRISASNDGSGAWRRRNGAEGTVELTSSPAVSCAIGFSDGRTASAAFANDREAVLSFADGTGLDMLFPAPDDGVLLARLIDAPLADPLYAAALDALSGE